MFLEGVEVPIIGIQYQGLPNAPIMASIQTVPIAEGTRLLPRTLVHVFFLDPYVEDSPFISAIKGTASNSEPTEYQKLLQDVSGSNTTQPDANDRDAHEDITQYKLLFGGEILGFDWTKDQAQRALVLQCADWSNYWDYAYQWNNTDLFGPGIKAMFSGGSTNLFTDFLSSPSEVITNILRTPSIMFPKLKGLAGGIVHMLEQIGGSYYYDKKIAGTNTFFMTAELRLHLNQMVVAVENDPTASRLLANQGYGGLFNRLLGGLGGQTSIRQCINALQGVIFHEIYAQPCPRYIPGTSNTVTGQVRKRLDQDANTSFIANNARGIIAALQAIKLQLRVSETRPDIAVFTSSKSVAASLKGDIISRLKKQQLLLKSTIMRVSKLKPAVPSASSLLNTAAANIGTAATKAAAWSPNNGDSITRVEQPINQAIDRLSRVAALTVVTNSSKTRSPARLVQHILRPDVWFSAPPRCNVIFPEQYSRLSYRRSFMDEPTRLLLKTNDEFFGEDELFDRFYFAPKTNSVQKGKATLTTLLQNDLLAHEVFTGILPVFEKMGELNIFAARGGVVKDRVPQVGLAQRSANFLYFKYRFAARQMVVSGRFNPFVALGFPGVVIDKYASADVLKLHNELLQKVGRPTRDINKLLGTSFLGNFTQTTVTANQTTGSMDIVVSYPRQPEESVEFLGATESSEVSINKRFNEDVTRITDVASLAQPGLNSMGPNLGTIVAVQEVTELYRGNTGANAPSEALSTKALLLYSARGSLKPRPAASRVTARVPVGIEVDGRLLDRTVLTELGVLDSSTLVSNNDPYYKQPEPLTIKVYRVQEQVPRFQQQVVDLPAEEYIRPGWYGDIWHPSNIGQAYDLFFATGAITDPHVVSDSNDKTFSGTPNGQAEANAEGQTTDDPNDPSADAVLVYQLTAGASIEEAVAFLMATYSHIKTAGLDVEEFIRSYTWRPVATMVDMFGTGDLQLSSDGSSVVQGIEGFHSRAFGPFNDLFGLVTPEIEEVTGIKRGTNGAQKTDTRKQKQDAVRDFLAGLGIGRGILG
jgi:hypothetical protein